VLENAALHFESVKDKSDIHGADDPVISQLCDRASHLVVDERGDVPPLNINKRERLRSFRRKRV
jgi:hypothetical protein